MIRAIPISFVILAYILAMNSRCVVAQTYTWLPGAADPPGDWNDKANWDDAGGDFVPEGGVNELGQINNGGTAFVKDVIDNSGASGSGKQGPGGISVLNGSVLEIRSGALMSTDSSGGSVNGEVEIDGGASIRFLGSGALRADILSLGSNVVYDYRVTSASSFVSAPATIMGHAMLDGTLKVDFGPGTSFTPGDVVRLIDAGEMSGTFSSISLTGNVSGSLGPGQLYAVQKVAGGNGTIAQLAVEQLLILTVNRDTMDMSISNPNSVPIAIDGYTVTSLAGGIADANFTGLGNGWSTGPTSTQRVTQLRQSGTTSFSGGAPASIGAIFDPPPPTQFGVPTDEVQFSYTLLGNVEVTGYVNYIGAKQENNLVLTIDENGMAAIQNESTLAVDIEGYTIASSAGLLDASGWNSLDAQDAEGGRWAASPAANGFRVTELMTDGSTTFTSLKGYSLGKLYANAGGSVEDVTFQFLIAGETDPFTGVVKFGDLPNLSPGLAGDFNSDGHVDAADYVVWRKTLGDPAGYDAWKANFGRSSGAGLTVAAVPEPCCLAWMWLFSIWMGTRSIRRGHRT